MTAPSLFSTRVLIPFAIATTIWGSTWIVIRGQLGLVPPTWSIAYRFVIGAIAMAVYARASGVPLKLRREHWGFITLISLSQFVANFNFVYRAEQHITSGLVAVLFALLLVPNALFSRWFLKSPVTGRFVAGSVIAMAGVGLLILRELRADQASAHATMLGVVLTLLGVISASIANVMQATPAARALPMATSLSWAMGLGALVNAGIALLSEGAPVIDLSPGYLFGVIYLGVAASAVAFTAYFSVIRAVGPAYAAYSSVITPVLAMILSTVFEGYRWTWLAAGGAVLAAIGLLVALSARRPEAKSG